MKILIDFSFDGESEIKLSEEKIKKEIENFLDDQLSDYGSIKVLSITEETEDIRDGYHSFKELYDHRIQLFIALLNRIDPEHFGYDAWKSKKHSDGSEWDGWFIAGLFKDKGQQITYHLPLDKWDELKVEELPQAPQYDGHTPEDVLKRLKSL